VKLKHAAWIGLALLFVVLGVYLWQTITPAEDEPVQVGESEMQSAVARAGDLSIAVSGSGELVAVTESDLRFDKNGELVALNVKVGDQVQEGDVLASLGLDMTEAELAQELTKADLNVLVAQQNLDQVLEKTQISSAQALLALEEAQQTFEALQIYDLEQALALQNLQLAEEAVQEAEMNLYIVNSAPSQEAIDTAYASLLFKEKELQEIQDQIAQAEYQIKSASNQMVRDRLDRQLKNLRLQLANQQIEYENALYKYETLDDPPDEIDLQVAEARLATAQIQLAEAESNWMQVQAGPPAGDLAMAAAQLEEARSDWERLKDGPDVEQLALLEAQLTRAELKLQMLQTESLTLDLVAPMDGTVLSIEAAVGDRVSNKTILTLADLSQAMIAVSLDEIDRASVQVGNQVEISFDAVPERTFQGEVVKVKPSLISVGNSQAFRIWVLLDDLPNDLIDLPLGINAGVDVITGQAQNSVLVTIDALQEGLDGGYSVYVISGENLEQRSVQIGLMDATTAEILAGLLPGERVAIGNLNIDQE
jgi:multidrug efflux pump subunit AcrA (membrane-fusion protein)